MIGWGSTKGAIEEAVEGLRAEGKKVASINLRFLQPMQPGIKEIMQRYKKVLTIETNWSDNPNDELINEDSRRYSSLATLLRSRYLIDVDCWTEVRGTAGQAAHHPSSTPGQTREIGENHEIIRHQTTARPVQGAVGAGRLSERRSPAGAPAAATTPSSPPSSACAATKACVPKRQCSSPASAAPAASRIT